MTKTKSTKSLKLEKPLACLLYTWDVQICCCLQDAAEGVIVFLQSLSERALQGSNTWTAMRRAQPAAGGKNEAGRPRCTAAARMGGLYLQVRFSHRDIKSKGKGLFKAGELWKRGLSIYPTLKVSNGYHFLAATCSTGVNLETVT